MAPSFHDNSQKSILSSNFQRDTATGGSFLLPLVKRSQSNRVISGGSEAHRLSNPL